MHNNNALSKVEDVLIDNYLHNDNEDVPIKKMLEFTGLSRTAIVRNIDVTAAKGMVIQSNEGWNGFYCLDTDSMSTNYLIGLYVTLSNIEYDPRPKREYQEKSDPISQQ